MSHPSGPRGRARGGRRRVVAALGVLCCASAPSLRAQQFRAVWADVFRPGMQSASQVDAMVARLAAGHYNAVVVPGAGLHRRDLEPDARRLLEVIGLTLVGLSRHRELRSARLPLCAGTCQRDAKSMPGWGGGGGFCRVSAREWPPAGNTELGCPPSGVMVRVRTARAMPWCRSVPTICSIWGQAMRRSIWSASCGNW